MYCANAFRGFVLSTNIYQGATMFKALLQALGIQQAPTFMQLTT